MAIFKYFIPIFMFWLLIHGIFRFLSISVWGNRVKNNEKLAPSQSSVMQYTNFIVTSLLFLSLASNILELETVTKEVRLYFLISAVLIGLLYIGLLPKNERKF